MIKINIKPNQHVYFTSDTHYNHKNLCANETEWGKDRQGTVRYFKTRKEMNNILIENINCMVNQNDILFHFGDWSFGGIEEIWNFRKRINCKNIYLFFGNHDHHIIDNKVLPNCYSSFVNDWDLETLDGVNPNTYGDDRDRMFDVHTQNLFTWCGHYGEFELIYPQQNRATKADRFKFIGCHYPIASWNEMGRGRIHLHGHLHSSHRHKIHQGLSMDVGVDGNYYRPYSVNEIIKIMKNQPIKFTSLIEDHHV